LRCLLVVSTGKSGSGESALMLSLRCRAEQMEAKWQGGGTFAVGQEAEVADAHGPFGEQMQVRFEDITSDLLEPRFWLASGPLTCRRALS
jgi:hypothetical protein